MTRLNNLQVLRAVAALWVVLLHTELVVLGWRIVGGFGVDIFFVISGFIMARICATDSRQFLLRRFVRIVPLYWAATLSLYFLSMAAPNLLQVTKTNSIELIQSLLFIPFRKGSGKIQPLLFVGWTLNYEMFFYVVLAFCLKINRRRAVECTACLIVLTIAVTSVFRGQSTICEFYSEPLSLEFVMGLALYGFTRHWRPSKGHSAILAAISGASLLVLIIVESIAWTGLWVRPFALGLPSVFLVGSAVMLSSLGQDTTVGWMVLLGDASYALYIVHQYVQMGIERKLAPRILFLQMNTPAGALISTCAAVAVGIVVHLLFEKPITQWLNQVVRGKRNTLKPLEVAAGLAKLP